MMKILMILSTLILFPACNEAGKQKENRAETTNTNAQTPFNPPKFERAFLENLYLAQMDIMKNPLSRAHKEKFILNAYIADKNTLISFGNARLKDPQTGNKIATPLIKRAALIDAKRWATYGLLWLNNDFKPDFGKIKGAHNGFIKEIATFNKGDSLIIAIASKVR